MIRRLRKLAMSVSRLKRSNSSSHGVSGVTPIVVARAFVEYCYCITWKEVADTLGVSALTHNRRIHSRRLIQEFSHAPAQPPVLKSWVSIDFHRAPGSLVYKVRDSPFDRVV